MTAEHLVTLAERAIVSGLATNARLRTAIQDAAAELPNCAHEPGPPRDGRCVVHGEWWPCDIERVRRILVDALEVEG